MPDYADTLANLQKARDEAREILVELHGVTKDAKQMKQEVMTYIRESAAKLVVLACTAVLEEQKEQMQQMMVQSVETITRRVSSKADEVVNYVNEKAEMYTDITNNVHEVTILMQEKADQITRMDELGHWCHDQIHVLVDRVNVMLELIDKQEERLTLHAEALLHLMPETEESSEDNGTNSAPQGDGNPTR